LIPEFLMESTSPRWPARKMTTVGIAAIRDAARTWLQAAEYWP